MFFSVGAPPCRWLYGVPAGDWVSSLALVGSLALSSLALSLALSLSLYLSGVLLLYTRVRVYSILYSIEQRTTNNEQRTTDIH